jgi:SAM-dependent methyltransferase
MSYNFETLKNALNQLNKFRSYSLSKHHERYLFPYLCGSYFSYRKVDILRIKTVAEIVSSRTRQQIKYLEVGCGNGDFLERIREYIPNAKGIENNIDLFYLFYSIGKTKPEYIEIADARYGIDDFYDIIFVGWMDPGQDFRKNIADKTDIIITTLDSGLSLAAEYEGYGFKKIVKWITPSWEDVNIEINNHFYSNLDSKILHFLSTLRGAHNFWYIYSKDKIKSDLIIDRLKKQIVLEETNIDKIIPYDFEKVLDECGFSFHECIENQNINSKIKLWKMDILSTESNYK